MRKIQAACRVGQIPVYYLHRKLAEVADMQAKGLDVISLGIGGPDGPAPEEAVETAVEFLRRSDSHSYQLGTGIPELRKAFSTFYNDKYGVDLCPESMILPLIGSKEGITHISLAVLNPGDEVLVPDPGYPTYTSVSHIVGAKVRSYSLKPENGWYPDFDELEKTDLSEVKLMWLNYTHMPTGAPASLEVFRRAVDFGLRHGILIAHDNPYSFILNDKPLSILSVSGAFDTAIEMNSLSKSHNMAGWRVGMVAGNPEFISWIRRVKSNIDSGQFRPVMEGAVRALSQPDSWYENINNVYKRRRAVAERVMDALGCTFDPNQTGLFLWGRVNDKVDNVEEFCDRILHEAHVFITPGFIFGRNGQRYVRISLCATEQRLSEACERICKLNL